MCLLDDDRVCRGPIAGVREWKVLLRLCRGGSCATGDRRRRGQEIVAAFREGRGIVIREVSITSLI